MKLILSSCDFRNDNARKTIIDNLSKPIANVSSCTFLTRKLHLRLYTATVTTLGWKSLAF